MLTLFDTDWQLLYNRCMKYFLPCFIAAIIPLCASASYNPMFGDNHKNSVSVHLGQGTGPGSLFKLVNPGQWDFMPQTMIMAQYSQPMTLFRLPARQNFNVVQNFVGCCSIFMVRLLYWWWSGAIYAWFPWQICIQPPGIRRKAVYR